MQAKRCRTCKWMKLHSAIISRKYHQPAYICFCLPGWENTKKNDVCSLWEIATEKYKEMIDQMIIKAELEHDKTINQTVDVWGGAGPDCSIAQREAA